ncbi:MAG: hypothetical protein WCB12_00945 [Bryobacteraceae bacterium]
MPVSTWRSTSSPKDHSGNRRTGAWRAYTLLLFPQLVLFGQSLQLQLSSAKASAGKVVTIQLSLTSPVGHEPLALQWETTFPADQLIPVEGGPLLGTAAWAAGKDVTCAARPRTGNTSGSKCIVIGGQQPIHNGVIAWLRFRVLPEARRSSVRVRVEGMAVSRDLKQAPLNVAEAVVQIRSK